MGQSIKIAIVQLLSVLALISCIKEEYKECPNWGKYRVHFYEKSNLELLTQHHMTLLYWGVDSLTSPLLKSYTMEAHSKLINSQEPLRLYPGSYLFSALLSSESERVKSAIEMKNGGRYLIAKSAKEIVKAQYNEVELQFSLANSLLLVECHLKEGSHNYRVKELSITPPKGEAILDLKSALCNYQKGPSSHFERMHFNSVEQLWYYHINPMVSSLITLELLLEREIDLFTIRLFAPLFLEEGLQQGRVHQISLLVSPTNIEFLGSTLSDWEVEGEWGELYF